MRTFSPQPKPVARPTPPACVCGPEATCQYHQEPGAYFTLSQRLATAEAERREWQEVAVDYAAALGNRQQAHEAALADAAALREQLETANKAGLAIADLCGTLRERVTRAEATIAEIARPNGLLCRTCGDFVVDCARSSDPGDECPGKLARAFLNPTEPDGASGNRQGTP